MSVSVLLIIGFAVLFTFASEWYSNRVKLENLAYQERILHNDMEHLEVVGKWTLDYVKIEKALTYLLGDRLSEVSFRILTEQLWQISQSYSLDPLMILAVVAQESRGNPLARGRFQTGKFSGALGLMQIKKTKLPQLQQRKGKAIIIPVLVQGVMVKTIAMIHSIYLQKVEGIILKNCKTNQRTN
jgi:hypothetical protein